MDHKDIDGALDIALSTYTTVEPPVGLERRILKRIAVSRAMSSAWLAAVPALAAAVLIAVYMQPDVVAPPAPFRATVPSPPSTEIRTVTYRVPIRRSRERLTREERCLQEMARSYPLNAQKAFSELRERADAELVIEEVKVAPLNIQGNRP